MGRSHEAPDHRLRSGIKSMNATSRKTLIMNEDEMHAYVFLIERTKLSDAGSGRPHQYRTLETLYNRCVKELNRQSGSTLGN